MLCVVGTWAIVKVLIETVFFPVSICSLLFETRARPALCAWVVSVAPRKLGTPVLSTLLERKFLFFFRVLAQDTDANCFPLKAIRAYAECPCEKDGTWFLGSDE